MARIENHKYSIEEAFRECFYIVPDYQREYVWTDNADYVQKELPTVELPTDIRASVESLCADWIGTKHDVIHELDELQESSNVEDRIRRIMSWLSEDMVKLQEQVCRLEALATEEDRYRLAYLLVGESGGNILRSFVAAGESADRVLEGR